MHYGILVGLLYLSIGDGIKVQLRQHNADVNRLKCEALPYRSKYYQSVCYFANDRITTPKDAGAQCKKAFSGSKLALEVPSAVWDAMFLEKDQYHSSSSDSSPKKAMCSHDFNKEPENIATIVKCGEKRILAEMNQEGAINTSAAHSVIFGTLAVHDKNYCEAACRCANKEPKLDCDCGPFSCLLPSSDSSLACIGYAYESSRGQCALLGEKEEGCEESKERDYTFDTLPSIVLLEEPSNEEAKPTIKLPDINDNPLCAQIPRSSQVKCSDDGYECPDHYLPYLVCLIYGQLSFTGGERISKRASTWVIHYSTGEWSFSESVAVNITCLPAGSHTYDPCTGNIPRLGNALVLDNAYGCIDGYMWNYAKTTTGPVFSSIPSCRHEGWTNGEGRLADPITEMWCRPDWPSKYPKCGQLTLGVDVICTEKGYTCPKGSLPYLACLIDNLWSFTGGKFVYKQANSWKVEYSTGTWTFEEKYGFNVTCKKIATHTHSICSNSIPRLGNALIKKDAYGCIDGFEWNYAKTKEGAAFHEIPQCSSQGWTRGGNLIGPPINEMWCKPIVEQNSRCGEIDLDEKAFCQRDGYHCGDRFLPYLSTFTNNQWSYTGGSHIYKEGSQWVVAYSSGVAKFNEFEAKNITCIYAGKPSKPACDGNVPRYGNAYLSGDTFNCITGFAWDYAKTVNEPAFNRIPKCGKGGWEVNGKKLASPIGDMWCKPM